MKKFGEYLAVLKEYRRTNQYMNAKKFILGNSSVDFDSCFGALVYGYIKYVIFNVVYLPLIDCPKSDIKLRFDIMYVMEYYKIDYANLYFTEQFKELWSSQNHKDCSIVLYDHNFRENVQLPSQIIDHHVLKDTRGCEKIIYQNIGSALTLLYYFLNLEEVQDINEFSGFVTMYKKFFSKEDLYSRKDYEYDPIVDQIIRCGILLDTFNLNQKEKGVRWNDLDRFAVQNIEKRNKKKQHDPLISLEKVQDAKFDTQLNLKLSLVQLYKKDYKIYTYGLHDIGYSIINVTPDQFISHFDEMRILQFEMLILNDLSNKTQKCLQQALIKRKEQSVMGDYLDSHIVMFHFPNENKVSFSRQAIIYSKDALLMGRLHDVFDSLKMKLIRSNKTQIKKGSNTTIIFYSHFQDPSASISRKILEKEINEKLVPKL